MLHTKCHGYRSTGSKDEDFSGFLPYMGDKAIWSCGQHFINIFIFPCTYKLTITFVSLFPMGKSRLRTILKHFRNAPLTKLFVPS